MIAGATTDRKRRGVCPGLSTPMPTGDGLLVRLMPIGTISLVAFADLCEAARSHGNGIVEISARGSIQVRGLNAASAPRFAEAVVALNIAAADGIPILGNALAGLDAEEILDAGVLAADLRRALARTSLAARLAAKVSIVVDGGGTLGLDAVAADVRLGAMTIDGAVVLRLGIGGDATTAAELGNIAPGDAGAAVMRTLEVMAQRGRYARARDILKAEGAAPFGAAVADLLLTSARPGDADSRVGGNERRVEPIGVHRLRDGLLACGIGLAFGHADTAALERLSEAAAAAGACGMRTAPGRTLMIIGLRQETLDSFIVAAERLGFVVRADDPRRRVVACAGAPICASAAIAARALAPQVAEAASALLKNTITIHISGCAKGCAHPAAAALTAVGAPDGCALVADGCAGDAPFATVAADELAAAIVRCVRGRKHEDNYV
jgi:precorrin-3B synthase